MAKKASKGHRELIDTGTDRARVIAVIRNGSRALYLVLCCKNKAQSTKNKAHHTRRFSALVFLNR